MTTAAPWSLEEFRAVVGRTDDVADHVLIPLLDICNKALTYGLTRKQVEGTFSRLAKQRPGPLPASLLVDELAALIDTAAAPG